VTGYNFKDEKINDLLDITPEKQRNLKIYYRMMLIKIGIDVYAIIFFKR